MTFKTRIKLKELRTYKDPDSNLFTIYITYSVHGRRDYKKANALGDLNVRELFPPSTKATISSVGWGDDKHKTVVYAVQLLLIDQITYRFRGTSWIC